MDRVNHTISELLGNRCAVTDPTPAAAATLRASATYPLESGAAASFSHSFLSMQYPNFAKRVGEQRSRLAKLMEKIINTVEPTAGAKEIMESLVSSAPEDTDFTPIFDFVDRLREVSETAIDEALGQHGNQQVAIIQNQTLASNLTIKSTGNRKPFPSVKSGLAKPQLLFEDVIDNSRETVWVPTVPVRHNALSPETKDNPDTDPLVELPSPYCAAHPYKREIQQLAFQPWQLLANTPAPYPVSFDEHPCEIVDTPEAFSRMMDYFEGTGEYRGQSGTWSSAGHIPLRHPPRRDGTSPIREVAIDVEHHSLRSFQGITCLLQISSREKDFLVDALTLRPHLHLFNKITSDPTIVKVLHGCDSDVVWLQRDFSIYLVNVFDTGQAARILSYPSCSLSYLLKKHANVEVDKKYQTADWRQRPLPEGMLQYARSDTHYLLGIYDRIKSELVSMSSSKTKMKVSRMPKNSKRGPTYTFEEVPSLLASALTRSADRSLLLYEKEKFNTKTLRKAMIKQGLGVVDTSSTGENGSYSPPEVTRIFVALFDWRDAVAREEDESPFWIMSNRVIYKLAMAAPNTVNEFLVAANPISNIVRERLTEVLAVIKAAKEGTDMPSIQPCSGDVTPVPLAPLSSPRSTSHTPQHSPKSTAEGKMVEDAAESTSKLPDIAQDISKMPWMLPVPNNPGAGMEAFLKALLANESFSPVPFPTLSEDSAVNVSVVVKSSKECPDLSTQNVFSHTPTSRASRKRTRDIAIELVSQSWRQCLGFASERTATRPESAMEIEVEEPISEAEEPAPELKVHVENVTPTVIDNRSTLDNEEVVAEKEETDIKELMTDGVVAGETDEKGFPLPLAVRYARPKDKRPRKEKASEDSARSVEDAGNFEASEFSYDDTLLPSATETLKEYQKAVNMKANASARKAKGNRMYRTGKAAGIAAYLKK